jgi:predicted 3-demethylubiquinone-9 3-methyltransferase (glyoxalase superfamily)
VTEKTLTTCLWFDTQGEEAARFYVSLFPGSSIGRISRYTEAGPGPAGSVLTVEFEAAGQKFLALNGGPAHQLSEAFSLVIPCADQDEVDYYWDRLADGGEENVCGWVKDRFGLSWQVVPTVFLEMVTDPDPEKVRRVTEAMFTMKKFDIAALQKAFQEP